MGLIWAHLHMNKLKIEEYSEKIWQMHISVSAFYDGYAKSVGLTLAEFKVLAILHREVICTQKFITQLTFLPKQTVNAIIKGFSKRGFINESTEAASDKRNKNLSLSKEGKILADKVVSKAKEVEYKALDSLGEDRRKVLLEAITIYTKNLKIK